ncbi:NAD(+) diphosphatase [Tsuneonella sp. YG55]|uniref:NAD(+) diphosphatase n=1 Tax=Tsuneonella litorea TaxID=2976475 RepID=A0A9X3AKF9_9SPHN|nr:NAD(+) diphosphatase [Tsuneonella litorea]MCT2558319.1 NAD(+) diphosphatase [Tsuneonella litorea]
MIAFGGSPLDRADHLRSDPGALAAAMDWRARLLRLDGLLPTFDPDSGGLGWGSLAEAPDGCDLVFLGLLDGKACFAPVPERGAEGPAYAQPQIWQAMQVLSPQDLAIYGGARSLVDWHARHRFCARCGGRTKIAKGGWQRDCPECGAAHFPRTDPVTIMLVEHDGPLGKRLLLGRQPRFPPRMFSALAGFVEPGETIEEAVAREVLEEAGVRVRDVRYIASQPWPFPSQLMIGCHAVAEDDAITIDETELEDARWFTHEELLAARDAGADGTEALIFPRSFAIAHHLVQWWLDR